MRLLSGAASSTECDELLSPSYVEDLSDTSAGDIVDSSVDSTSTLTTLSLHSCVMRSFNLAVLSSMMGLASNGDFVGGLSGISGSVSLSDSSSDADEYSSSMVDAVADAGTVVQLRSAWETDDYLRAALAALVMLSLMRAMGAAAVSSVVAAAAVQVLCDMMGCGISTAGKIVLRQLEQSNG